MKDLTSFREKLDTDVVPRMSSRDEINQSIDENR